MRRPLEDILSDHPELTRAESRGQAEQHLEQLFLEAQGQSNAYAAERLEEIYEVAERALALGGVGDEEPRVVASLLDGRGDPARAGGG